MAPTGKTAVGCQIDLAIQGIILGTEEPAKSAFEAIELKRSKSREGEYSLSFRGRHLAYHIDIFQETKR